MKGRLLVGVGAVLLIGLAVAAVAVSLSSSDPRAPAPGPGPTPGEEEGQPDLIPPPLSDRTGATDEIAGRVVGPGGSPIGGALVTLLLLPGEEGERSGGYSIRMGSGGVSSTVTLPDVPTIREIGARETDGDGRFSFHTSEDGPFTLRAELAGFATETVGKVEKGDRDVEIRLARAGVVRGLVVETGGAPIPGAVLKSGNAAVVADESGAFRLPGVPAGEEPRAIHASAGGFESATVEIAVAAGGVAELPEPITLEPVDGLTGRVFDPAGKPLAGVAVYAQQGYMGGGTGESDLGGRYHITDLEGGDLTVTFRHSRYLPKSLEGVRHTAGGRTVTPDVRLEPGGVIAGRVLDPEGEPVAGAGAGVIPAMDKLDLQEIAMMGGLRHGLPTSDAEGNFECPGLATSTYTLIVDAPGYKRYRADDIEVRVPETTRVEVRLEIGNCVAGRVVDGDGNGIAGVAVSVTEAREPTRDLRDVALSQTRARTAESAPDGSFEVRGLGEGEVSVTAQAEGFASQTETGVAIGTRDLTLKLVRTGSVSGLVLDEETGDPLQGATVRSSGGWSGGRNVTDEKGTFLLKGIPPGTCTVSADHPRRVPSSVEEVQVREGEETGGIEIRLERGKTAAGVVVGLADGRPVAGAQVALRGGMYRIAESDEQGRFLIEGLADGLYVLETNARGYASDRREGVAVPVAAELRVTLTRGGTVRGIVRDENGEPQSGQMVLLGSGANFGENASRTDSEGKFTFENVKPGRYTVMVLNLNLGGGGVGFDSDARPVTVEEGEEAWVEFGGVAEPKKTNLTGRVLSRGEPLASQQILLMRVGAADGGIAGLMSGMKMVSTDSKGNFSVEDLEPGRYRVMTGDPGGNMQGGMELEIDETGEVRQDIVLPEGRLSGVVTGADGKPLAGATVVMLDPVLAAAPAQSLDDLLGMMLAQATTKDDGTFEIGTARVGACQLQVSAEDLAYRLVDGVDVRAEVSAPLRIELERGSEVEILVVSDQGVPVPGVPLVLLDGGGRRILTGDQLSVFTGGAGVATFRLMPGSYRVIAQHSTSCLVSKTIRVARDERFEVALAPAGRVSVTATRSGRPVEGALVRFFREDGTEVVRHLTQFEMMTGLEPRRTDAGGNLTRSQLPVGLIRVVVEGEDGGRGEGAVQVRAGEVSAVAVEVR